MLFEQANKAFLLEMMVGRERLGQPRSRMAMKLTASQRE
jgi:hypothetical protein